MTSSAAIAVVAFYAGLNGVILLCLAADVGRVRARTKVFMGDGGNPAMIRAMRGQLNFVETVPYSLLLLLLLAFLGAPLWALHGLGLALTLGRLAHGVHFILADAPRWQRAAGTLLTMLVLLLSSAGALILAAGGMV